MQLHELFDRHRLGALQHLAGALIRLAHLALLFVGQRHYAQRENLVNLGSVKQVSGTLRSNLRIVIENDRRRENGVELSFFTDEDRPSSHVLTTRGKLAYLLRRREQ